MSGYVTRERKTDGDGRPIIVARCGKCGTTFIAPDKGLGRAHVAAFETRHQHIDGGAA